MVAENKCSLEVDYNTIAAKETVLAYFIPEAPVQMLEIMDNVLKVGPSLTRRIVTLTCSGYAFTRVFCFVDPCRA